MSTQPTPPAAPQSAKKFRSSGDVITYGVIIAVIGQLILLGSGHPLGSAAVLIGFVLILVGINRVTTRVDAIYRRVTGE